MERTILDVEGNKLDIGDEVIAARGSWTIRCWVYQIKNDKIMLTRDNIQNTKINKPSYDGYTFLDYNKRLSTVDKEVYRASTVIKTTKDL